MIAYRQFGQVEVAQEISIGHLGDDNVHLKAQASGNAATWHPSLSTQTLPHDRDIV
jgi:hypothetical protein